MLLAKSQHALSHKNLCLIVFVYSSPLLNFPRVFHVGNGLNSVIFGFPSPRRHLRRHGNNRKRPRRRRGNDRKRPRRGPEVTAGSGGGHVGGRRSAAGRGGRGRVRRGRGGSGGPAAPQSSASPSFSLFQAPQQVGPTRPCSKFPPTRYRAAARAAVPRWGRRWRRRRGRVRELRGAIGSAGCGRGRGGKD